MKLIVEGPCRLKGNVKISGAKNAALPIMAACLLTEEECTIKGVPDLLDVRTMMDLLGVLGAQVERNGDTLRIRAKEIKSNKAPYELVRVMRASFLVLGPLFSRVGKAVVSLPGGCAIGERPVNLHIDGIKRIGGKVRMEHGYVIAEREGASGGNIYLDIPTVTGTENLLMASVLLPGETIIENPAREPEVVDLFKVLVKMGADIEWDGIGRIKVRGVEKLCGFEHRIIPDRIEAGTFMVAAAITGGDVVVEGVVPDHLDAVIEKLRECGCQVDVDGDRVEVRGPNRPRSISIVTAPYPGFPTDMQAQFMALLSVADGTSTIRETIFERRFMHAMELARMGAQITIMGDTAFVRGVEKLHGAEVTATDLRASASLVVAGLRAHGKTVIGEIHHLDRGYEKLDEKLRRLGAWVERRED